VLVSISECCFERDTLFTVHCSSFRGIGANWKNELFYLVVDGRSSCSEVDVGNIEIPCGCDPDVNVYEIDHTIVENSCGIPQLDQPLTETNLLTSTSTNVEDVPIDIGLENQEYLKRNAVKRFTKHTVGLICFNTLSLLAGGNNDNRTRHKLRKDKIS
ncbi:hypothetical protein RN001_006020, partial [Aquatica leii]